MRGQRGSPELRNRIPQFSAHFNHPNSQLSMNYLPTLLFLAINFISGFLTAEALEYGILTHAPVLNSATWETPTGKFSDKTLRGLYQRVSKQAATGEFNASHLLTYIGSDGWKLKTHSSAPKQINLTHQVWTFERPGKSQGKPKFPR